MTLQLSKGFGNSERTESRRYYTYKTFGLVVDMERRLEWLRHVGRMDQILVIIKFFKVSQSVEEKWEGPY